MSESEQRPEIDFTDSRLSLEDIKAAGYHDWGGCGGWYGFERRVGDEKGDRYSVPYWVRQMISKAEECGCRNAQRSIRLALGLPDDD